MRTSIALVALVLLVAAPIGTAAAQSNNTTATPTAQPTATETPGENESVEWNPDDGFTLQELQLDGTRQDNSPPGVRMGERSAFWAVYWPASNPFAEPGTVEGGENLEPDTTIGRNSIYLRTWTYEDRPETVKVAFYRRGTRTVQRGNTTTEVPVARNVTIATHDVTFERGRPTVEIPLPNHDQEVQAVMWIEGEEYARWTFAHKSLPTTQSTDIDSQGDYLASAFSDFLLLIIVGGFVSGSGVKRALDRAGIGPQYGYMPWFLALSFLTGAAALFLFQSVASLAVNAKWLISLYVVGIFTVVLLETYTTRVSKALFLRPRLSHTESPTGDEAYDILDGEAEEHRIVRNVDGTVSIVKPGLLPFLARVFGKSAEIENIETLRTRVELAGEWDELLLVDPEADHLVYHEAPSWELDLPEMTRENAPQWALVGVCLAATAGAIISGTISGATPTLLVLVVVAVVFAKWALRPVDGVAAIHAANVHLRTAFGTLVQYAEDVDDAKHFEQLKEELDTERISKQRQVDQEVASHDTTLVEGMLDPEDKVPASIDSEDERDDEIKKDVRMNGDLGKKEAPSDD